MVTAAPGGRDGPGGGGRGSGALPGQAVRVRRPAGRLDAFRAAHSALAAGSPAAQDDIDAVFAPVVSTRPAVLPKGLSAPTAEAVLEALAGAEELSAAEAADAVGISRVSARRYLEHFVNQGQVEVRLKYGGAGRPERRYRLRS